MSKKIIILWKMRWVWVNRYIRDLVVFGCLLGGRWCIVDDRTSALPFVLRFLRVVQLISARLTGILLPRLWIKNIVTREIPVSSLALTSWHVRSSSPRVEVEPVRSSNCSAAYVQAASNGTARSDGSCRHKSSFPPTRWTTSYQPTPMSSRDLVL